MERLLLDAVTKTSILLLLSTAGFAHAQPAPQTVEETWARFDPKAEPLEIEVIRKWKEDAIEFRHVRYVVGTFEGRKTRASAFYAFPENTRNLPAIVQVHGGGQRAETGTVKFWASHGYATIAVNWGEKVISGTPDAPNTDWAGIPAGFLDPKHHNDVSPGEGTLYDCPHPWNSSWLLYSAAARRAITFLERQPEVDANRIGLTGHSMGGRLTVLTAIDPGIKAASPSVGGSGYLYQDIRGVPGSARHVRADLELYSRTLDCRAYWPLIRCPLLFLGATNDFNSPMEKVMRGFRGLPQSSGGLAFAPHMNHRFTSEAYASRVRWFQAHLKGGFDFPSMPASSLRLKARDGVPVFTVTPNTEGQPHRWITNVEIFYGYARDPRTRFWRAADVKQVGFDWLASCPVMDLDEPLFAFANVTYRVKEEIHLPAGYRATSKFTVSSLEHQAWPHQLREAGVKTAGHRQRLIDDFRRGWQDWFIVAGDNPHHWNFKTHKVNDPAFFGPRGAKLAFEMGTTAPVNTLAVIMETDQWRGYTGRKTRRYTALVELSKAGEHGVRLPVSAFVTPEGEALDHYDFVTGLILTPGNKQLPSKVKTVWQGNVPTFSNLRWEGGECAPRPKPYLADRNGEVDADAASREQFEKKSRSPCAHESILPIAGVNSHRGGFRAGPRGTALASYSRGQRSASAGEAGQDLGMGRAGWESRSLVRRRRAVRRDGYPMRVAEFDNIKNTHPVLHDREITLAEVLKTRGYATGRFGKWDLTRHSQTKFRRELMPNHQGFDNFFGTPTSNDSVVNLYRNQELIESRADMNTLTERYTDEAIQFIRRHKSQAFLVYLPHTMPHTRLGASDDFCGKSPRGLYGDVVEEIASSVGRILDLLKEERLADNTYVLFTSDNGPWLIKNRGKTDGFRPKDHGGTAGPLRSGKVSTWKGGARVPAVFWAPGRIEAGTVCPGTSQAFGGP